MKVKDTAQTLPQGACDCHTHVFLDEGDYPFFPGRRYTPPPAPLESLLQMHSALGIQRVVIVQPSVYGLDNASTLHALHVLGKGRARGVVVIDEHVSEGTLREMAAAGVCGVRVNLEIDGERDSARASALMQRIAERIAPHGWHVQFYCSLQLLADCSQTIASLPVPVVFDHFAGAQARRGLQQDGLGKVLKLVENGNAYVKLSATYRSGESGLPEELEPIASLLIKCNPERMLWGSDWPHPRPGANPDPLGVSSPFDVDLGAALRALRGWSVDEATFCNILTVNPARLYGFGD